MEKEALVTDQGEEGREMIRSGILPGFWLGGLVGCAVSSRENRWNRRYQPFLLTQHLLFSFQYFLFKNHPFPAVTAFSLGGFCWPPSLAHPSRWTHSSHRPSSHPPRLQDWAHHQGQARQHVPNLWPLELAQAWAYDQSSLMRVNPELLSFSIEIKSKAADDHFTTTKKTENQNWILPELFQGTRICPFLLEHLVSVWLAAKSPDKHKE